MPADRFELEFECENGHWVGLTTGTPYMRDGRTKPVVPPTKCPRAACRADLHPFKARRGPRRK